MEDKNGSYSLLAELRHRIVYSMDHISQPVEGNLEFLEDNIMVQRDFRGGCDDSDEEARSACSWWKSAAELDYVKLRLFENSNASKISPRIRLLRELERLALLASESLNEIRHKLLSYRAGDFWVPTGGISKQDLEIPAVNTILLLGFHNAGKTSLVNLMYRVFARSGLLHFAQTSSGRYCACNTKLSGVTFQQFLNLLSNFNACFFCRNRFVYLKKFFHGRTQRSQINTERVLRVRHQRF